MASRDEILGAAKTLQEAGVLDLDKPISAVVDATRGIDAFNDLNEAAWNALFGSGYVFIYPTKLEKPNIQVETPVLAKAEH